MTATASYRKTKAGEWVVCGPTAIMRGGSVLVAKRDGSVKRETIERLGRPFATADGEMVYGYIGRAEYASSQRPSAGRFPRRSCITGGNCSSFSGRSCGGHDCDAL